MKGNWTVFLSCLVVIFALAGGQAMAVNVYGEGAYSDTNHDVQVCIYADIGSAEALRSFGVRLIYNPTELTFDGSRTTKNEAVWYFGDGTDDKPYREPEDIQDGPNRAVVIVGGKLDTNPGMDVEKVSGTRVLLCSVWFSRASGSGPLANPLTLALGKVSPYANFVKGPDETDVLDGTSVTFGAVNVYQRGDASGDGRISPRDIMAVKAKIGVENAPCYADCTGDGFVTPRDINCVKAKIR